METQQIKPGNKGIPTHAALHACMSCHEQDQQHYFSPSCAPISNRQTGGVDALAFEGQRSASDDEFAWPDHSNFAMFE